MFYYLTVRDLQSIYQRDDARRNKVRAEENRALSKMDDGILARTSNAYINEVLILSERSFVSPP